LYPLGDAEIDIFLQRTARADCTGVFAAMTGINAYFHIILLPC
jgi:hypothetical protein